MSINLEKKGNRALKNNEMIVSRAGS